MDEATYCSQICQAKCCYLRLPDEDVVRCPHLTEEKTCGVYGERYAPGMPDLVVVGYFKSRHKQLDGQPATRPFWCGRMKQLFAAGMIPPDVAAGCCVIRPELLNNTGNTA